MSELPKKDLKNQPEVSDRATRRRYSKEYKERILAEADRCTQPGELGALLRREGLYWSNLKCWLEQLKEGALGQQRRGRKQKSNPAAAKELARLKRENERLTEKLRQAELIIEVQKKVSEMMKITPPEKDA